MVQVADERLELPLFTPDALQPGVNQLLKRKQFILREAGYLFNGIQLNIQDGSGRTRTNTLVWVKG